jgi:hypothetical protein
VPPPVAVAVVVVVAVVVDGEYFLGFRADRGLEAEGGERVGAALFGLAFEGVSPVSAPLPLLLLLDEREYPVDLVAPAVLGLGCLPLVIILSLPPDQLLSPYLPRPVHGIPVSPPLPGVVPLASPLG